MDDSEIHRKFAKIAEENSAESTVRAFTIAPVGDCPASDHPEKLHGPCHNEVSVVSLVIPGIPALGLEIELSRCVFCGVALVTMGPYNVTEGSTLQVHGAEITSHTHKSGRPPQG